MADNDDLLKQSRDAFQRVSDAEAHNRQTYRDDYLFARKEDQWPEDILKQRAAEGRPALTISKMNAFIRQVVNDARQNKPSIRVHPVDSGADRATAEVINGLIRNIEYTSNADVAYDTATECAVTGGFGYIRIGLDYAHDDSFDLDLSIQRVSNPLAIYGDPHSTAADSSDWNSAFVVDRMTKDAFKAQYGDKSQTDWDDTAAWASIDTAWRDETTILVAERWIREEVERKILLLSDRTVVAEEDLKDDPDLQTLLENGALSVNRERMTKTHKVRQVIMTGLEVLENNDWPGRYIPIVPVYGDEFDIEGKRYFRSLIHSAIGAQQMFNYWRTTATELVALAPRVPFIGPKGAFDSDSNWSSINTRSHPYLEYDWEGGMPAPPQRQPLDMGMAAGAMQEALSAADDMKGIIGLYDASLGARSNETSGKAILARQREGDVSTFHFMDNMARAIRHTGRILIDLIPKVYSGERVIRIIGEDGSEKPVTVNAQTPEIDPQTGKPAMQPVMGPDGQPQVDPSGNPLMQPVMRMHDLSAGKYDLTVTTGPSFTTRREEAAAQMTELIRAFPQAAPVIGPELAKNLDWPGADKIAEKLEAMSSGQVPPELKKQIEQAKAQLEQVAAENQKLKHDNAAELLKLQNQQQIAMERIKSDREIAVMKLRSEEEIERAKAETNARVRLIASEIHDNRHHATAVAGGL